MKTGTGKNIGFPEHCAVVWSSLSLSSDLVQPWFEKLAAHLKYPAGKNPVITSQQQKSSTAISCTAKKQGRRWEFEPRKTIIPMVAAIFYAAKYRLDSGLVYKA